MVMMSPECFSDHGKYTDYFEADSVPECPVSIINTLMPYGILLR